MKCLFCGRRKWNWQADGYGPMTMGSALPLYLLFPSRYAEMKRNHPERYHWKCFRKAFGETSPSS